MWHDAPGAYEAHSRLQNNSNAAGLPDRFAVSRQTSPVWGMLPGVNAGAGRAAGTQVAAAMQQRVGSREQGDNGLIACSLPAN